MTDDPRDLGYGPDDLARHPAYDDPADYRHPFARDYDRLVHATAFRRLQGKTGVVAPGEADFFRTRLTHTIEVGQLARRLAERLGAHPDCCESAAVLHDFGHPPFGHIGEEALGDVVDATARDWGVAPDDVGGYEGNAQNFRLVVRRLSGSGPFPGLNLTRATLDASIKYPWRRGEQPGRKWCFYPTEADEAARVREPVPDERRYAQSFEAQLMDWADDVAYSVHDLEDWYLAGFLPLALLTQSKTARDRLAGQLVERREQRGKLKTTEEEGHRATADEARDALERLFTDPEGPFEGFARLGGEYDGSGEARHALRVMRKRLFEAFARPVVPADPSTPPRRHHNDLAVPREARLGNDVLRDLLWIYVIDHPRMATYQHGQRRVVTELFEAHAEAVRGPAADFGIFPRDVQPELERLAVAADRGSSVETIRLIADHVGAMTDDYAARLHRRLTGHVDSAFIDFV